MMRKILITSMVVIFLSACEKSDISSKYMDFFPYENGKVLSFNTNSGAQSLNSIASVHHADYGYAKPYELFWNIEGFLIKNDSTLPIEIALMFSFYEEESKTGLVKEGSNYGKIKVIETMTYVPSPIICQVVNDTLLIPTWDVTIIKHKGLTKIKWPKKESVSKSEIESYPNTPWGETWTLIE